MTRQREITKEETKEIMETAKQGLLDTGASLDGMRALLAELARHGFKIVKDLDTL